jgi:serine/threonine-protein kinase/endoribonuclease IRE1
MSLQELLGPLPEGFLSYFTSKFPHLLMEVYRVLYDHCREEDVLSKYFRPLTNQA